MRLKTERWDVSEAGCPSLTTRAHDFSSTINHPLSLSLSLSLDCVCVCVCVCVHACWELIISGKISQSSRVNRAWKWKWKQVSNCKPIFLSTHSPFPVLNRLWRWISEHWWFGPGGSDPISWQGNPVVAAMAAESGCRPIIHRSEPNPPTLFLSLLVLLSITKRSLSRLWRWISEHWWFGPGESDPFPGGATLLLQPRRRSRVFARSYTDPSLTLSLSLSRCFCFFFESYYLLEFRFYWYLLIYSVVQNRINFLNLKLGFTANLK